MLKLIVILVLIMISKCLKCQSELQLINDVPLKIGDSCAIVQNGTSVNGICQLVINCPTVFINVVVKQSNHHTVCGYDGVLQIICCPSVTNNISRSQTRPSLKLNLPANLDCRIPNSNELGEMKFVSDCPDHNQRNASAYVHTVCIDQVCSDLVCCSNKLRNRLKTVCAEVDNPSKMLELRLLLNQKCIVQHFNIKGRYQRECDYAKRNPNMTSLLQNVCIDEKCEQFYCCPENLDAISEPVSIRKCNSYIKYLSQQQIEVPTTLFFYRSLTSHIFLGAGGIFAEPGEFPHIAALGFKPNNEILWRCGGSLISDRYVLTAAHCLTDRKIGLVQKVRLGVVNLLNDINTDDCPEDFDVAKLIPHPQFNLHFVYNDIGLIELAVQVKFNYHIRPICLPKSADDQRHYESMGWGATGPGDDTSVKLIKVMQDLFTYEECKKQYDVGRKYPEGILNDTQICAGSRGSIQSTCPGDSGGPLVVHHASFSYLIYYIHGIVSFGTACGFPNSPGVYTKVYPYVNWIEAIVWNN